jgi:hypothetical protein
MAQTALRPSVRAAITLKEYTKALRASDFVGLLTSWLRRGG